MKWCEIVIETAGKRVCLFYILVNCSLLHKYIEIESIIQINADSSSKSKKEELKKIANVLFVLLLKLLIFVMCDFIFRNIDAWPRSSSIAFQ